MNQSAQSEQLPDASRLLQPGAKSGKDKSQNPRVSSKFSERWQSHNEESQTLCVPNLLTFQRRQLRPEVDGGGGIPPTFLSGTSEVQH